MLAVGCGLNDDGDHADAVEKAVNKNAAKQRATSFIGIAETQAKCEQGRPMQIIKMASGEHAGGYANCKPTAASYRNNDCLEKAAKQ